MMKPEDVTDEMLDAAQDVADRASLFGDPWATKRAVIAAAINAMPQTDAQIQIDALKAERDALRGALLRISELTSQEFIFQPTLPMRIARAALANKEQKS